MSHELSFMRVHWKHLSMLAIETMACYEVLKFVYSFTGIVGYQLCDEHKSRFLGHISVHKGPRPQPCLSEYTVILVKLALSA